MRLAPWGGPDARCRRTAQMQRGHLSSVQKAPLRLRAVSFAFAAETMQRARRSCICSSAFAACIGDPPSAQRCSCSAAATVQVHSRSEIRAPARARACKRRRACLQPHAGQVSASAPVRLRLASRTHQLQTDSLQQHGESAPCARIPPRALGCSQVLVHVSSGGSWALCICAVRLQRASRPPQAQGCPLCICAVRLHRASDTPQS